MTTSTWTDADCTAQLDDVALYNSALTASQTADLARGYGLQPSGPKELPDASEGSYVPLSVLRPKKLTFPLG